MPFSFYYACLLCFLWSGCFSLERNTDQNTKPSTEDVSNGIDSKKNATHKDDKLTLHINNATPDQVSLFTEKYKNFSAETYLFFQPHIHQIVLDGQDPDWVPSSDGQYCIDKGSVHPLKGVKTGSKVPTSSTIEQEQMSLILPYANHCKKTSVLLREFTNILKTYVYSENSCALICGCAIRKGEMTSKHKAIQKGIQVECVASCNETKNTCLTLCSEKKGTSRAICEDKCRDISHSAFCDSKSSCCSLNQ